MPGADYIYAALKSSLLRQAISEGAISTKVPENLQALYSINEILYRYYDHAERGQRYCKQLKLKVGNLPNFGDRIEEQDYSLAIGDLVAGISICFRATRFYKKDHMDDLSPCLDGNISETDFDKVLHELANGAAHVRTDPRRDHRYLVEINNVSAQGGTGNSPTGFAREVYSTWLIGEIRNLILSNFVACDQTYFQIVMDHITTEHPGMLGFQPFIVPAEAL